MHGAGNDYIYIDTMRFPIAHPEKLAIAWSDRHKGIGGDGIILIGKNESGRFAWASISTIMGSRRKKNCPSTLFPARNCSI